MRRGVTRMLRDLPVAQGRVGPGDQVVRVGRVLAGTPFSFETRQVLVRGRVIGRQQFLDRGPAAVRTRHLVEARRGLVERVGCLAQQVVDRRGDEVTAGEQERQQVATDALALGRRRVQRRPETIQRAGSANGPEPGIELLERADGLLRCCSPGHFRRRVLCGHPRRQGAAEQLGASLTLTLGSALPVERRRFYHLADMSEKARGGFEPLPGALEPLGQRRKIPSDQRQDAEDCLAGPQRRVPVDEMSALVLGNRDLEIRVGQGKVHIVGEADDGLVGHAAGGIELATERPQLVGLASQAERGPLGQPLVVAVDAGERRRHRPAPVDGGEEPVERDRPGGRAGQSSGSVTHRRSLYDRSTALIVSCTHAPSSKLPSLASSSARISPMKLLIRLA